MHGAPDMATPTEPAVTVMDPLVVESPIVTAERSKIASPFGWAAIFAGAVVTLGAWLVLHLIGIGIGLTAIDTEDASNLRAVGIGTGVWSLLAPILALFIGGIVAGRVAPTINTGVAAIHGAVVWGLTAIGAFVLLMMMLGSLARGVASAGAAVGGAVGQATGAVSELSLDDLGLRGEDLVEPINRRLRAEGKPEVTPDQMEAAAQDALRTAVRQGRLDRQLLVDSIAKKTDLSRADAQEVASQIESRYGSAMDRLGEFGQRAQQTALEAVETTGKVMLWLALAMVVGLGAAVGGSILSVRHERREHVVLPRAAARPTE
jgi:hypothetical protein